MSNLAKKRLRVSREHRSQIKRLINETDWAAFWDSTTKKSAAEIDAYRYARAKSALPGALLAAA